MAKRTITLDTKEIEEIVRCLEDRDSFRCDPKTVAKLERSLKTIKVRSAKAKGMSFQKDMAEVISGLTGIPVEKDGLIESRGSGQHGTDIILRGEARELFPYSPECKNQENLNLLDAISQAKENELPNTDWLIFHRRKTLKEDVVILGLDAFIKLYRDKISTRRR